MGIPNQLVIGQAFEWTTQAENGAGVAVDADALPTYSIYEDGTDTAILTGTMAKLDDANTTGLYRGIVQATEANGFERYKTYNTKVSAVIGGTTYTVTGSTLALGGSDTIATTSGALTTLANFKAYIGETGTENDALYSALITRATSAIQLFCGLDFIEETYREIQDWDGSSDVLTFQYPIISVQLFSTSRVDAFGIRNTSSDSYNSYVQINDTTMTLVVQGGTNAGSNAITLSDHLTLTALQTAITALNAGWDMTTPTDDIALWSPTELLPISGINTKDSYSYVEIPGEPDDYFVTNYDSGIISGASIWNHCSWMGRQNLVIRYTAGYATIPGDLEQICIDLTKIYSDSRTRDGGLESEKIGDYSYKIASGSSSDGSMPSSIQTRLSGYKRRAI
jgi:hypothetical protein